MLQKVLAEPEEPEPEVYQHDLDVIICHDCTSKASTQCMHCGAILCPACAADKTRECGIEEL